MSTDIETITRYAQGEKVNLTKPQETFLRWINACIVITEQIPSKDDKEGAYFNGGKLSRRTIVLQLMKDQEISQQTAYKVLAATIDYLGVLEYPDLRPEQVWAIRCLEFKHDSLMNQWNLTTKTWYMNEAIKVEKEINKIKGVYDRGVVKVDYNRWKRPRLVATTDPKALVRNTDHIAETPHEDVDKTV